MAATILGRPPGISDDDIDVDLPDPSVFVIDVSVPPLRSGSMASAVHYIKLKQIGSQIQRAVYTVAHRNHAPDIPAAWSILGDLQQWEREIPGEASLEACGSLPCCSSEWFELRAVETRLQLLRALCSGDGEAGQTFMGLLAADAARGCQLQYVVSEFEILTNRKRMLHLGQPLSTTSLHSAFTCGFNLLYAVFRKPTILPLKDVFDAVKAASTTLFTYSQGDWTSAPLYDVFEELSSICIDRVTQHSFSPAKPPSDGSATSEWRKASENAVSNVGESQTNATRS